MTDAAVDLTLTIGHARLVGASSITAEGGSDLALVRAAQSGDRDAFGLLYQRYGPMVHGLLLARVPYDEVDDLLQDVFVAAMQRLASLRSPAAFGGWLAAIARNRAADYHRRPADRSNTSELPQTADTAHAAALEVMAVIRTLPLAYRETLTLRLVEGMTGPEIALRTGLTAASVRVNLHRGMKQLREKLAARGQK